MTEPDVPEPAEVSPEDVAPADPHEPAPELTDNGVRPEDGEQDVDQLPRLVDNE